MTHGGIKFCMGLEQECLTVARPPGDVMDRFFGHLSRAAPSLPDGRSGLFNPYGRVYVDGGSHLELASAEADSPLALVGLVQQQEALVSGAVAELSREGPTLVLANNNYSGVLRAESPVWGSHENYLVPVPPTLLAERMLPFLATRVYAGAGGVLAPSGRYVAGVRTQFLTRESGGGTVADRAIHSTARQESLMGPQGGRHRYHLILGDGHRSQLSLALQFGATALALQAVAERPDLVPPLPRPSCDSQRAVWVRAIRRLNVLAEPGVRPRVHPLVPTVQRIYLDGARRWADSTPEPPPWIPAMLDLWQQTLEAFERDDRDWLARRLDPWIKYDLLTGVLRDRGYRWELLPSNPRSLAELALVDQRYHEFCNPQSPFRMLDDAGVLRHQVVATTPPGAEDEPFVPRTGTRAEARARFLVEYHRSRGLVMDWHFACDSARNRACSLEDPFAEHYGPWQEVGRTGPP